MLNHDEKGWTILIGLNAIVEPTETKEEVLAIIKEDNWKFRTTVIAVLAKVMYDKLNNEK